VQLETRWAVIATLLGPVPCAAEQLNLLQQDLSARRPLAEAVGAVVGLVVALVPKCMLCAELRGG